MGVRSVVEGKKRDPGNEVAACKMQWARVRLLLSSIEKEKKNQNKATKNKQTNK